MSEPTEEPQDAETRRDLPAEMPPEVIELAHACFDMARHGDAARLGTYLGRGLPADLTDARGNTLLMLAAYHGRAETVRVLIEHGADVDRLNENSQSPIAGAIFKGEDEVVRLLLAAGADLDNGMPTGRATAQMFGRTDLLG